jgi:adenosylmethionine-8-amino-7-oxononanoate aminotransferase
MSLSLTQRDLQVIWHPYTQHKNVLPPIPIVRGEGALLFDEHGNSYIDAISSWWVNIHGHGHPYIAEKIHEQAKKLEHVIFTGFTHAPAINLAERLLMALGGHFARIFYSDNGSTAVEVAIKMALQYWAQRPGDVVSGNEIRRSNPRSRILAFRNAYHGDTFGAMSVSERGVFTYPFRDFLFEVSFIDVPTAENMEPLKSFIGEQGNEIACFIYEPLLQAAGGMLIHEAALLDELLTAVQAKDIICIADEVMTGFYRTCELFATDYLKNKPDVICLSKGLTGGTMALGVTAATQKIFDVFLSDDRSKTFFHGHSFTANPIACASALASLDLMESDECKEGVNLIVERNRGFISQLTHHHHRFRSPVKNLRQLGTILAFEVISENDHYLNTIGPAITQQALQKGIYLRPLGNTVYIMPPYCITADQLKTLHDFLLTV